MKTFLTAGMVLLPQLLFAGTDCRVKEFPDHYLATCDGDSKGAAVQPLPEQQRSSNPAPEPQPAGAPAPAPAVPPATGPQATGSPGTEQAEVPAPLDPAAAKPAISQRTRDKQRVERMKEIKRQTIIDSQQ
ncbi:hypothetical protein GMST_20030 [Geomonas silvestris]|uniref:Uncharacterized protein n=1 Tax=Geomonas silvestris TaxID=2740184 RepID=A0A6V8MI94_9BACT|nr:hypothetical protein [Geomonas silvestris]GFO59678.1 hypothetical protein GMST_20030 [Geomonas silvestris]